MRKLPLCLFALILIVLVVSCSENPGTTTMKLILSTASEEGSRTLLPSDSTLLDVSRYTITGVGPNGKTFTRSTDNSSVEIEGLTIGEWTVTAKGLNREGTELVSGSHTFTLTATAVPQTVVLDTLVGTGTFSFVLDWSLCDVANPALDIYLTGPEMTSDEVPLVFTMNSDTKTATVSETLSAGSYKIRVILKDGSTQVAGLVEAVRISNGTRTSGTHTFHFSELGPSTLTYFRDATGTPIRGQLAVSGNPETFLSGNDYTYVFTFSEPDKVNTDGLTIDWYYDGNLYSSGSSLTSVGSSITVEGENGVHRVDAVVYNKLLGSTGSASYTFTVVPDGEVGEMTLVNENAAGAIATLDSSSIISALPGDLFLVTTPNAAKMYVCSVSSGTLQVLKTYDGTNFPWLANTKHVFSDCEMNVIVATDNFGGTENFTALMFNPTAKTLSPASGMRFEGSNPTYSIPFTNFSAAAFSGETGTVILSDSGTLGFDYVLRATESTVTTGGTSRKKSSVYYNVSDMDINPMGNAVVYSSLSSSSFVSATVSDSGTYVNATVSQPAASAISHIRYVNDQTVVAANSYELTSFKVVSGGQYTKYKTVGISLVDMAADGQNYFYVADNSNRIVSFEVYGHEISQLGSTTISNPIRSICLSGKYLAAMTAVNTIALFEVIQ